MRNVNDIGDTWYIVSDRPTSGGIYRKVYILSGIRFFVVELPRQWVPKLTNSLFKRQWSFIRWYGR